MTSWRGDAALIEQLHDPARLLGDDARRDPHAVDHDRDEDQDPEHRADDQPARVRRRVERLGRRPRRRRRTGGRRSSGSWKPDTRVARSRSRGPRRRTRPSESCRSAVWPIVSPSWKLNAELAGRLPRSAMIAASSARSSTRCDRVAARSRPGTSSKPRAAVLVEDREQRRGGPVAQLRVGRDDRDRSSCCRGRRASPRPAAARRTIASTGEDDRRDEEQPAPDELAVLAPRDVADVRQRAARRGSGVGASSRPPAHRRRRGPTVAAGAATRRRRAAGRRPGARCSSSSAGRPTWSMKICSSDSSSTSKWRHARAGRDRRREDRVGLDAVVELDLGPVDAGPQDPRPRHARQPRQPVVAVDRRGGRSRRPVARWISRSGPPTTTRPWSTIAIDSHIASTVSIWWVEKISVLPASRSSRNASRRSATFTGSRPGERLVHEQDLRVVEDRRDQLDLLLVALRQLLGPALGEVRDAEPGEPVERASRARRRGACRGARRRRRAGRGRSSAGRGRAPRAGSPTSRRGSVRRVGAAPRTICRRRRASTPRTIRIVVVLPAPFAPRKPKTWPPGTSNVEPVERDDAPEALVEVRRSRRVIARER